LIDLVIAIINWNGESFIGQCLDSVRCARIQSRYSIEVVCVDNNSSDRSLEIISRFSDVEVISLDENVGFAPANNIVFNRFSARYYLMLNPDTVVDDPENFNQILDYMEAHREVGIVGCKLRNEDGSWQKSIGHHPTVLSGVAEQTGLNYVAHRYRVFRRTGAALSRVFKTNFTHFDERSHSSAEPLDVDFVWGAYLLFRKEVKETIGLLDENFYIFGEESDFCLRATRYGWKTRFVPLTSIVHLGGGAQRQNLNRIYYWHIAMYFWFFAKNAPAKLAPWRVLTFLIQASLLGKSVVTGNDLGRRIHYNLAALCVSPTGSLPTQLKQRWGKIN